MCIFNFINCAIGRLPHSICKLRKLQYLDLSNNHIVGPLPPLSDLSKLSSLKDLFLVDNSKTLMANVSRSELQSALASCRIRI